MGMLKKIVGVEAVRSFGLADTKPCFGVCPLKGGKFRGSDN